MVFCSEPPRAALGNLRPLGNARPHSPKDQPRPRAENVAETWPAAAYQLDPTNADGMPNFILCWGWGASEVFHVVAAMRCVRLETTAVRHPRHLPRPTPSNPQTPFQPPPPAARTDIQKVIAARRDCHSGSRDCHVPPRGSPPIPNRIAPSVGCRCSTSKVPATKKEFYSSSHASFLPHSIPRRRHTQWPLKGWTKRASSGVSSRRDVSPS